MGVGLGLRGYLEGQGNLVRTITSTKMNPKPKLSQIIDLCPKP